MNLRPDDLLDGERPLVTKFANMVISVKESGLSRFACDDCVGLVGLGGKEAIGGKAHLTNYRILFKSHSLNRAPGAHSILLPNVQTVSATFNALVVETANQRCQFVMWFKRRFLEALNTARADLNASALERLKQAIVSRPEVMGNGLRRWATIETIHQVCLGARRLQSVFPYLSAPERNAFVEILELLRPKETV